MLDRSLTPSITVTIGRHTRLYFAFITTAPAELDLPATITLLRRHSAGTVRLRGGPVHASTQPRSQYAARLVLVDALELAWQRAKYEGNSHLLIAADPVLVGLNTLQHWLWHRLLTASLNQVAA